MLDTNIIISGLLWRGNEDRLLRLGLAKVYHGISCDHILDEVTDVLQRHVYSQQKANKVRRMLAVTFEIIPLSQMEVTMAINCTSDRKDAPVLAATIKAKAILVTGDKQLIRDAKVAGSLALRTWEILKSLDQDGY